MDMVQQAKTQAVNLLEKSRFPVTEEELKNLQVLDFGLGRFTEEGAVILDLLRSPRLRITLLILLPNQTLPQHLHPAYEGESGKEETLRVVYGQTKVYLRGDQTNPAMRIPVGKEPYYTARQEIALSPGQQYTVPPTVEHWFQAGPEGSVNLEFQNRVDETRNLFSDPHSSVVPVKTTGK